MHQARARLGFGQSLHNPSLRHQEIACMGHRARITTFRSMLAMIGLVLTMGLTVPLFGQSPVAAQGNSQNAHACTKGGWQNLQTSDGLTFANQGDCVSAAAQGADLIPIQAPNAPLAISWAWAPGQTCTAYATLAGWVPNTTYTVAYSYTTPIRPVSGSQRLTTDATGAAYGWIGNFGRQFLVTFSVNDVIVSGFPDC
jgi:hypothetical protein